MLELARWIQGSGIPAAAEFLTLHADGEGAQRHQGVGDQIEDERRRARGQGPRGGWSCRRAAGFPCLPGDLGRAGVGHAHRPLPGLSGWHDDLQLVRPGLEASRAQDGVTHDDVVLAVTNTALGLASLPVVETGNGNGEIEPGECNLLRIVLFNKLGGIVSGVSATLTTTPTTKRFMRSVVARFRRELAAPHPMLGYVRGRSTSSSSRSRRSPRSPSPTRMRHGCGGCARCPAEGRACRRCREASRRPGCRG